MSKTQAPKGILKILKDLSSVASKINVKDMNINEDTIDYIYNNFEEGEISKETIRKVLKYNSWHMQLVMEEMSKKLGG